MDIPVVPYDPEWPNQFRRLAQELARALGPLALRIEHVGSTAVPGLAAKPVIDIDVVIDRRTLSNVIAALRQSGYEYEGDLCIVGREAFRAEKPEIPHHLYVCDQHATELLRHIAFRDLLRANASEAEAYAALKRQLASRAGDRKIYTEGKTSFIAARLANFP